MKANIIYVHKCSKCSKVTPICKMFGFETLFVCHDCYEDTLLTVSAIDYYILKENMQQLKNSPLESQLDLELATISAD